MAAEMTALQLIDLLRSNPGACGMLGCEYQEFEFGTCRIADGQLYIMRESRPSYVALCRTWLTGAVVEKHIERELPFPKQWCDLTWSSGEDAGKKPLSEWTKHPTFLHAALAALESHAKEAGR